MESRSRRRLWRSPPPHGAGDPDGADRISALADDMLLQILVRLRCARAAARTGLLSRRWRGLWARLPGFTFRDIPAGEIKSALARVARRTAVSHLEIRLSSSMSGAEGKLDDARAKSLLRADVSNMECRSIRILTPLLRQLKLKVHGKTNLRVFIAAPMVEKVWWWRTYTSLPLVFGFWWLQSLRLESIESYNRKNDVLINNEKGVSQLSHGHVLSMEISSYNRTGVTLDFACEIEKLPVADFSVLELHLNTKGHAFGAFVLHLLRMHHIRTTTQKLKVVLLPCWFEMPQASECLGNCPRDEPRDWRSQKISFTRLEELEINNFRGRDQEIDFVRLIFGCAPMLTRMVIRLAYEIKESEIGGCAMTIYNICLPYPSVNCIVYLSSREKWSCGGGLRALPIVFH